MVSTIVLAVMLVLALIVLYGVVRGAETIGKKAIGVWLKGNFGRRNTPHDRR